MNFKRTAIASTIALLVSGACTYALSRRMSGKGTEAVPQVRYVVPTKALQAGEILKVEDLETVGWPATNPVPGASSNPTTLLGRSLLYPMEKGQPIIERFLTAPGAGTGLSGRIPDGMRAIALRSDEVMGVAGFLLPGSHLDVLVTLRTEKSPEPATSTVLQDAEVLAAGHQIAPDPEGKPATVTVVTLLLTPTDAERAVLASSQGAIHFVLRSGSDKVMTHDPPIVLSQLSGVTPPVAAKLADHTTGPIISRRLVSVPTTIETITGDKQTTDSFGGAIKQ